MRILKTSDPAEAISFAAECIQSPPMGHEGLDIFLNRSLFLQTGVLRTSDRARAAAMGIPVWEAGHLGGSIVCFPGDLSLCRVSWGPDGWGEEITAKFAAYLETTGKEVRIDGNDVLLDGKKVMSWAEAFLRSGWVQTVAHFSVNTDLDLIRELCTKPMLKTPGQLSDYGITAEKIISLLGLEEE